MRLRRAFGGDGSSSIRPTEETPVDTRAIAVIALVIAVIVLLIVTGVL